MINSIPKNNFFRMINDKVRNLFYYQSLTSAKDKVVIDVGAGTGILSAYALHHGAKFVYAIERGQKESVVAKKLLSENFDTKKFRVVNKDFWSEDIFSYFDHDIEILVSETINYDILGEGLLKTWRHIRPNVTQNFESIPNQLQIDALLYKNPIQKFPWLKTRLQLTPENLLHKGFATSLNNIHEKLSAGTTQHLIDFPVPEMIDFDNKIDNVIDVSFKQYDGQEISFECTVDCPSLIVFCGKILCNDNVLYVHNPNNPTHWSNGLSFYFDKPGTYKVIFVEDAETNLIEWTNDSSASEIWPYNCSWKYNLVN